MKRTNFMKVTPLTLSAIAFLTTGAISQAQSEGDLPPLQQAPAQPKPWVQTQPQAQPEVQPQAQPRPLPPRRVRPAPVEQPLPSMEPGMQPRSQPSARAESRPVNLARQPWRPAEPVGEPELPPVPTPKGFFQVQGSIRVSSITDQAFGMFADDKALGQIGAAVSYTVLTEGNFSFAPGLSFEMGGVESSFRGDASKLNMQRLSVRLDGRYHFVPWAYGFVRAAPGAIRQAYEVNDPMAPAPMRQSHLAPSVDASAGVAFLIVPHRATSVHHARFWLEVDGGYGWAGRKEIVLTPDVADDYQNRLGSLNLGDLALRGGFVRFAASLTF
jgi:hypothetical protein